MSDVTGDTTLAVSLVVVGVVGAVGVVSFPFLGQLALTVVFLRAGRQRPLLGLSMRIEAYSLQCRSLVEDGSQLRISRPSCVCIPSKCANRPSADTTDTRVFVAPGPQADPSDSGRLVRFLLLSVCMHECSAPRHAARHRACTHVCRQGAVALGGRKSA